MADHREQIKDELEALDSQGSDLYFDQAKRIKAKEEDREPEAELKVMNHHYQGWYSAALRVVDQLLPDRVDEFRDLYRHKTPPKSLTWTSYTVSDYLSGTAIRQGAVNHFNADHAGMDRFGRQIQILRSANARLDSVLGDITGVLEAELFDDELDAAMSLLTANHLRSAGIVAGVVLERHLKRLVANHEIAFRKKATLANLNEALKTADVYGVPEWRKIQHLTDLRNLCGHDGDREPTKDEVDELLRGVERTVSTIF